MAEVYKFVKGTRMKTVEAIARHHKTQRKLDQEAKAGAVRARAILSANRDTGASSIDVDRGQIDRYVEISEGTGQSALSIEYDHYLRDEDGSVVFDSRGNPIIVEAPKPLRRAFGLVEY